MASFWLCLLPPSILFSFPLLALFPYSSAIDPKQFLFLLTIKATHKQKDLPHQMSFVVSSLCAVLIFFNKQSKSVLVIFRVRNFRSWVKYRWIIMTVLHWNPLSMHNCFYFLWHFVFVVIEIWLTSVGLDFFTGSDSIQGTWCKDILQTIMNFTPHNWASHTLSCFPAPLQVICFWITY